MAIRSRTEAKILDAADELFFTRGIAATSIDAVTARAGVSAATLYRGYPSKEHLLAAALERRHRAWIATWDDAIAHRRTAEGRLLAVFDALDAFRAGALGSRWCAFLGSAAEYVDPPAEVADALAVDTAVLRTRLAALAQEVVPTAADALADELLLVVTGELAMRLRAPDAPPGTARRVAEAVLAGRRRHARRLTARP